MSVHRPQYQPGKEISLVNNRYSKYPDIFPRFSTWRSMLKFEMTSHWHDFSLGVTLKQHKTAMRWPTVRYNHLSLNSLQIAITCRYSLLPHENWSTLKVLLTVLWIQVNYSCHLINSILLNASDFITWRLAVLTFQWPLNSTYHSDISMPNTLNFLLTFLGLNVCPINGTQRCRKLTRKAVMIRKI